MKLLYILFVFLSISYLTNAQVPANDNCANAITLTFVGTTATAAGTNVNATVDLTNSGCNTSARNVWYKFVAIGHDYTLNISAGTIQYPTVSLIEFPTSCVNTGGIELNCNSYSYGTSSFSSASISGTCKLSQGKTYYIMVDRDYNYGTWGTFNLTLTNTTPQTISGDDINLANSISTCGQTFNGSTIGATNCGDCRGYNFGGGVYAYDNLDCNTSTDPYGYGYGGDVNFTIENSSWYQFCNVLAGTYTVQLVNAGSCTGVNGIQIAIFTGSPTNLTPIAGGSSGMNILSGSTWNSGALSFTAGQCVYVLVDGYGGTNCNYTLKLIPASACTILASEVIDFNGNLTNKNSVLLSWRVATEDKIKKYNIYKSSDGINYQSIGMVHSMNLQNAYYKFEDHEIEKGIIYYKLGIGEIDGTEKTFDNIVVLNFNKLELFSFDPNPVNDKLIIQTPKDVEHINYIEIFNSNGLKIKHLENINVINQNIQIETSEFSSGLYSIQIYDGDNIVKKKIIISN